LRCRYSSRARWPKASPLKKTWGEQIVGNTGIGLILGLLGMALFIIGIVIVIVAANADALVAALPVLALLVVALALLALVSSALNGIYVVALYQYAAEGGSGATLATTCWPRHFVPNARSTGQGGAIAEHGPSPEAKNPRPSIGQGSDTFLGDCLPRESWHASVYGGMPLLMHCV
jgi:hypothetical protein